MRTQIGTPIFMAPEQFSAMKLVKGEDHYEVGPFDDFKADIWGLGCFIWQVLTFTYPFQG